MPWLSRLSLQTQPWLSRSSSKWLPDVVHKCRGASVNFKLETNPVEISGAAALGRISEQTGVYTLAHHIAEVRY